MMFKYYVTDPSEYYFYFCFIFEHQTPNFYRVFIMLSIFNENHHLKAAGKINRKTPSSQHIMNIYALFLDLYHAFVIYKHRNYAAMIIYSCGKLDIWQYAPVIKIFNSGTTCIIP